MVVVIGVAVLKPWSNRAPTEPPPHMADQQNADPRSVRRADPRATPERSAGPALAASSLFPVDPDSPISLAEARRRGFPEDLRYDVLLAVLATGTDTSRVRFRDEVPPITDIGYCDTGALLETPVEKVAFATAMIPVTSFELTRVFEKGAPVPIPVETVESAPDGFVLRAREPEGFAIGHYALLVRAYGANRVVPFCVAEVERLENGARARYVPRTESNAAARQALVSELADASGE
jgi:hypothetical protein